MKIYCQQCKYIRQAEPNRTMGPPITGEPAGVVCDAPENVISKSFDTWYRNVKNIKHKQPPKEINKNNDCSWYEFEKND